MSPLRRGPWSWDQLVEKDLSGSDLLVSGSPLPRSIDALEIDHEDGGRVRFLKDSEEVAKLPVRPPQGPLFDEDHPSRLAFAVGLAGEGFIVLPEPAKEFLDKTGGMTDE